MSNKAGGDATGQGLLFGRYRPVSVMMVANFATTTKGFDILTERPVIITTLKKTKLASARSRVSYTLQQMRSDAALATKRTHPSTLDIYDQVEDDENCHIISEFTEYSPITRMHAILTKDDVFSVMEAFEKIVNIMQYLNQSGVFGCCVREGNVFISPTGDVKIDNLFSSRLNFIADLPELGPHIAGMAVADGGAFLNRDANIRLDLKLIGGVLKSLLYLANKKRDAPPAGPEKAEESQIANRAALGQIVIAWKPPSTIISMPVMKEPALLEASRRVAPMSSSALPKREAGVWRRMSSTRDSSRILRFCSAGKKPGTRVLTRMSLSAHSRARLRVRLWTAALDSE